MLVFVYRMFSIAFFDLLFQNSNLRSIEEFVFPETINHFYSMAFGQWFMQLLLALILEMQVSTFGNSFAVLEVGDGAFEVLSTSGDTHLGGDDFDKV